MIKKQFSSRLRHYLAFLLVLTMIFGSLGSTSWADNGEGGSFNDLKNIGNVTFSIETRTINGKDILAPTQVPFEEGDTVYTLLKRVTQNKNIPVEAADDTFSYIKKIGDFTNGCFNNTSGDYAVDGWTVAVNENIGEYPLKIPTSGDVVKWQFSVAEFGKDTLIVDNILKLREKLVEAETITDKTTRITEAIEKAKTKLVEIDDFVQDGTWNDEEVGVTCPTGITVPNYWAYLIYGGKTLTGNFSDKDTSELTQLMRLNKNLKDAISDKTVATSVTFQAIDNPAVYYAGLDYDFEATITPGKATKNQVEWKINEITGAASIGEDGKFRPSKAGMVLVQAFHEDINLGKVFAAQRVITIKDSDGPKFDSLVVRAENGSAIDLTGKESFNVVFSSKAIDLTVTAGAMESTLTYKYKKAGRSDWVSGDLKNNGMIDLKNCLGTGENVFHFSVENKGSKKTHIMTINKIDPASLKALSDQLIAGIAEDVNTSGRLSQNISYGSDFVIGLYGAGKEALINEEDKTNFLAKVLNEARVPDTAVGALAKNAIALTAMKIDPTQIPKVSGGSINLIKSLSKEQYSPYGGIYSAPYLLMAYDLKYGKDSTEAAIRSNIIDYLHKEQGNTSYWENDSWGGAPTDKVALVAAALAPHYATNDKAKASVNNAITWLKGSSKNGFGNTNSDAAVILALAPLMKYESIKDEVLPLLEVTLAEMLTFKLADGSGFDYMGNSFYNSLATIQGLQALAAYSKYSSSEKGEGNIFDFDSSAVSKYENWPEGKFPLEIFAKPPTKTIYKIGEYLDTTGMEVKAKFSDNSMKDIATALCKIGWLDTSSAGTKTVDVDYLGKHASFTVVVNNSSGGEVAPEVKEVTVTVEKTPISREKVIVNPGQTSVLDVLKTAASNHNISMSSHKGYVSEINGYSEFGQGANSGWLYKVDGVTPPSTGSDSYKLKGGESINWYYTTDYTKDSSSTGWNPTVPETEGLVAEGTSTVTAKVTAIIDSQGKGTATIDSKEITSAITEATKLADKSSSKKTQVKIVVSLDPKATSIEVGIPKSSLNELSKSMDFLTISSPISDITLGKDSMKLIESKASSEIKFLTAKVSGTQKPTYEFSITSGKTVISDLGGYVNINIPYTPEKGENSNSMIIKYIDKDGKETIVKNGFYDVNKKAMEFAENHFSQYAIEYNPKGFTDVGEHWAKDSIAYLAAREMVFGKSKNKFYPDDSLTRAEFIAVLANKSGADLGKYNTSAFKDVSPDDWFYNAVAWAEEMGFVTGIKSPDGGMIFNPNAKIKRQNMAVILDGYEKVIEKVTLPTINKTVLFTDASSIYDYAKEPVATMQKAGIINGFKAADNTYYFAPDGNATRGEAARMIANMMKMKL